MHTFVMTNAISKLFHTLSVYFHLCAQPHMNVFMRYTGAANTLTEGYTGGMSSYSHCILSLASAMKRTINVGMIPNWNGSNAESMR